MHTKLISNEAQGCALTKSVHLPHVGMAIQPLILGSLCRGEREGKGRLAVHVWVRRHEKAV